MPSVVKRIFASQPKGGVVKEIPGSQRWRTWWEAVGGARTRPRDVQARVGEMRCTRRTNGRHAST